MAVPNLKRVLRGWTESATASVITPSVVDFEKSESEATSTIKVNVQPLSPTAIQRKPEETWSWEWLSLREPLARDASPTLKTDDKISIKGKVYRIDKVWPWGRSGFAKYDAVEDYQ